MDKIGERIRKRREYLEISMNNLSSGIGITSSMLSQIENGKASPSLHTIKNIADYLNTSVGALIGENDTIAQNHVITWDEKKFVKKNDNGATLYLLTHYSPIQMMEVYMVELSPGANSNDLLDRKRNDQEYCFVIEGKVNVTLSDFTYEIESKSSIYFSSHNFRQFQNNSTENTLLLWIISPFKTHS